MKRYHDIFAKYLKQPNPDRWDDFPALMWNLGFEMDCYHSFEDHYQIPYDTLNTEKERQDWIIEKLKLCPTQIVGNYVFSRYRHLTHWCDYGYDEHMGTYFFEKVFPVLENKMIEDNIERIPIKRP